MSFDLNILTLTGNPGGKAGGAVAGETGSKAATTPGDNASAFAQLLKVDDQPQTNTANGVIYGLPGATPGPVLQDAVPAGQTQFFSPENTLVEGEQPGPEGLITSLVTNLVQDFDLTQTPVPQSIPGADVPQTATPALLAKLLANAGGATTAPVITDTPLALVEPPLTDADGKNTGTPPLATSPGVRTGLIEVEQTVKTISPQLLSVSPGTQTGPVVAELASKTPQAPVLSTLPETSNQPVITGATPASTPAVALPNENPAVLANGNPRVDTGPVAAQAKPQPQLQPQPQNAQTTQAQAVLAAAQQGEPAPRLRAFNTEGASIAPKTVGAIKATSTGAVSPTGTQSTSPQNTGQVASNTILAQASGANPSGLSPLETRGSDLKSVEAKPSGLPTTELDLRASAQTPDTAQTIKTGVAGPVSDAKHNTQSAHTTPRLDQAGLASFAASLAQKIQGGSTKFELRLDPAELGKVQIKLEVSVDNRVEAVVSTHRPEVLADLQRGADALRRALSEAGFELGSDGLSFSLEQGAEGFTAEQDNNTGAGLSDQARRNEVLETATSILAESDRGFGLTRIFDGRVDVKV